MKILKKISQELYRKPRMSQSGTLCTACPSSANLVVIAIWSSIRTSSSDTNAAYSENKNDMNKKVTRSLWSSCIRNWNQKYSFTSVMWSSAKSKSWSTQKRWIEMWLSVFSTRRLLFSKNGFKSHPPDRKSRLRPIANSGNFINSLRIPVRSNSVKLSSWSISSTSRSYICTSGVLVGLSQPFRC